tara:strand:+ start:2213 stop:2482 length:270 start_codon:yes stop_codon:yes gene_type:complete
MQIASGMTNDWTSMQFLRIFRVMSGWKVFSSGHISGSLPAVSDVFPFRVSLYIASRGEEYSISCGRIKGRAYNASDKRRIRKNTFVKRE